MNCITIAAQAYVTMDLMAGFINASEHLVIKAMIAAIKEACSRFLAVIFGDLRKA
jgi:hypothetical protein